MKNWKAFAAGVITLAGFIALAAAGPLSTPGGADGTAFIVESPPGTACTATGTDAVCIGDNAEAGDASGDNGVLAIGMNAVATGTDSLAIGQNTDATGVSSIAIGGHATDASSANATGQGSISIGILSDATFNYAIAIGRSSQANGTATFAIGRNSFASASDCIAIGGGSSQANAANCTGASSIAFGNATLVDAVGNVAIGDSAEAITGAASIAIGRLVDATGANCIAIGGNATDGDSADCSAADSVAIGQHILADDIGEFAFASGEFTAQSDAHTSIYVLRNQTTDGTQTELFTDASAGTISVDSDCTNIARISIVARQANEDGTNALYFIVVGHGNDAGTTAELAAPTITDVFESANASGWSVDTTADDTNDSINILVTGAASDNINWVARAEIVESCG